MPANGAQEGSRSFVVALELRCNSKGWNSTLPAGPRRWRANDSSRRTDRAARRLRIGDGHHDFCSCFVFAHAVVDGMAHPSLA